VANNGEIKKMKIMVYNTAKMEDKDHVDDFIALVNPESYAIDMKTETKGGQGQGTSGKQQKFSLKLPDEFTFEFLLDNTGIIDGKPSDDISKQLIKLQDLMFKMEGKVHEPRHVYIIWGNFKFKGRVTNMTITCKLFNPDGSPIRASVKLTVKKSDEEQLRILEERKGSPDLTHKRMIKKGESLPWLCNIIYGDPKYYVQVASVNKISNFRNIQEGTEIYFPPFNKKTE